MGAGKKEQGMVDGRKDPTALDGTQGKSHVQHLESIFSYSPIFDSSTKITVGGVSSDYSFDDSGITAYYSDRVLNGGHPENADFKAKEGAANLSMDYALNIPTKDPNGEHKDLGGIDRPYKIPNPTVGSPLTPHVPESKRPVDESYQIQHESVSFGAGIGSQLSIEKSSEMQGESSFTHLTKGVGPATAA